MTSQLLLFSQPRSGSHLLERMLGKNSNTELLSNPFSSSRIYQIEWLRSQSYADGMSPSARSVFEDEVRKGISAWQDALAGAQTKAYMLLVHAHAFFPVSPDRIIDYIKVATARQPGPSNGENFTMVPDDLLFHPGTVPIFTIRDPRLVVPSAYRAMQAMGIARGGERANFLVTTCNIWNRVLYDFYVSHGTKAIIVDADDYMTSEKFVQHLCSQIGLDPARACFSWSAATQEEAGKIDSNYYASQSTLISSSGMNPDRAAKNIDLEKEVSTWNEEFGDDVSLIEEVVELALPYYEYLYQRRLKI